MFMQIRFAENLKALRLKRKLTQWDIAFELEKVHTAISHWENGRSYPHFIELCQLADILKCTLDELVYAKQTKS
jgi:transcriptional regulator with XRE-family HTH domain